MQSGKRLKAVEVDRLSSLPDDLIFKILSYVDIIYSLRLSVLSSRLRFIRTSLPDLNLESAEVCTKSYSDFVNYVLSARNNKIDLSSISMSLDENPELSFKRIMEYAFSHNVQQLSVRWITKIPPSLLSSKSLKHLTLTFGTIDCRSYSPWDFPALTTLHLDEVELYDFTSILPMCQNLKNLTLERCKVFELKDYGRCFTITNSRLLSLTLKKVEWHVRFVIVDTPHLKNFIFVDETSLEYKTGSKFSGELTISARDLTYLRIRGSYLPKLSLDGFPSLEKVDLCISSPQETDVDKIRHLFQRLHNVKSLSLSLEIVERLSTSEEVISHQPSPFPCLKSLKIYPSKGLKTLNSCDLRRLSFKSSLEIFQTQLDEEQEAMKINVSAEVANYLLGSSSNATFTMVAHEEARTLKITVAAYRIMAFLWKHLEKKEAYTDTKRAKLEWKKTLADSCPEDLKMMIRPPGDTEMIFRLLQNIKVLLTKVLASKRVEMKAYFSRLCAKSKTVVNKMVDDMKNQCEIKKHNFNGYIYEIDLSS